MWSNGATTQAITASASGDYSVTVKNASGCSATSAATTVTVNPLPTATITADGPATFCQGGSVGLSTSTGTGYSYQWKKGGVAISGATAATYSASTSGDYTVTVTNATDCPATSAATTVKVTLLPTAPTVLAAGEGNQTTCSDGTDTQTLTAAASAPGGASIVWYTTSTGMTTTTTPTQVGVGTATYYAAAKTTDGDCESVSRTAVTLTINALPSAAFSYSDSPYCTSGTNPTPTVTGTTGGSFSSTPGLSLNSSTGTINLSTSTAGTYEVTYSVFGTCGSTATASVTITNAPVATFSYASSSYCTSSAAVAATLGTGATAGTFTSTTGLTLDASTGQITPSSSTPGTYTVTNTIAASGGCPATPATFQVVINTVPAIVSQPQSVTQTVDQPADFTATATGTNLSYQWYKGTPSAQTALSGATNATYSIASVTTSDAGDYYVVVSGTCAPAATSTAATLTVNKADASKSITLIGLLGQTYTGSPLAITATSTVSGSSFDFTYNGEATEPTNAGSYNVVATLNNANYSGFATGKLVIGKAEQAIAWTAPDAITYGTPLGNTQLNATVTTGDGTLTYTPASGAVLDAGTRTLSVTAAETDNYNAATKTVDLQVNKATQTIAWTAPDAITYGTPLGNTQLNATVAGVKDGTPAGTLSYEPVANTLLNVGTYTLKVTAAETDDYNEAVKTVNLTVNKADQVISWATPAAITYGTKLSDTQLNATVAGVSGGSAPGALTYTPGALTLLDAGTHTLTVKAAETPNYKPATATVSLKVNQQSVNPVADTYYTGSSFYWTTGTTKTATLNLVATLKTNANYDGDIRTAKVSFGIRNANNSVTLIAGAQNLPVGLVNPDDASVGTAAKNVQYSIKTSAEIIHIAVIVSGNYNNLLTDASADKAVTIAEPTPGGLITGGGEMDNDKSAGYVKGAAGKVSDYNFYVQYNKSRTNPQGGVEIKVRSYNDRYGNVTNTLHTYVLKSTAIAVLATTSQDAQFSAKANISEDMGNGVIQSIEGNCTMQLDMYDGAENQYVLPATTDQLAVTIYRNAGGVWYSNNWNVTKTERKSIIRGSLSVSGTGPATTPVAARTTQSGSAEAFTAKSELTSTLLEVYPNPMAEKATIHFHTEKGGKAQVYLYDQVGRIVSTLFNAEVQSGQEYYLPLNRELLADGVYFCRLISNGKVENKRITIMR